MKVNVIVLNLARVASIFLVAFIFWKTRELTVYASYVKCGLCGAGGPYEPIGEFCSRMAKQYKSLEDTISLVSNLCVTSYDIISTQLERLIW